MTCAEITLGLALTAGMGLGAYVGALAPPGPPFGQYRESPMFQPKGRAAALAIAGFAAALVAFLFFAIER